MLLLRRVHVMFRLLAAVHLVLEPGKVLELLLLLRRVVRRPLASAGLHRSPALLLLLLLRLPVGGGTVAVMMPHQAVAVVLTPRNT